MRHLQSGDPVILRLTVTKEDYGMYKVDLLGTVVEVRDDGKLLLVTRRGQDHVVDLDDPRLRRPSWWERHFKRFPRSSRVE